MVNRLTFSVSELNQFVKKLLEYEHVLNRIQVRGEVSNLSLSGAGHAYFTLKDEDAAVRCVWFTGDQSTNLRSLKDGVTIIAEGAVTLYIKGGEYQLVVRDIKIAGLGYWYEKFLAVKQKLESEGLFDPEHKKQLPTFPKVIGVVTSGTGAAIQDIQRIVSNRYPLAKIRLYPVAVQGVYAAGEIAEAIDWFSQEKVADVLIVGRGGGSIEDLWPFNEEIVARSVFDCTIPVVSAVGHESDYAICDFVADVREATPSSAATRVTPNREELLERITMMQDDLYCAIDRRITSEQDQLLYNMARLESLSPERMLHEQSQRLDYNIRRLQDLINYRLKSEVDALNTLKKVLFTLNPRGILSRGYAMVSDANGHLITSALSLDAKKEADIIFADGKVGVEVLENKYE